MHPENKSRHNNDRYDYQVDVLSKEFNLLRRSVEQILDRTTVKYCQQFTSKKSKKVIEGVMLTIHTPRNRLFYAKSPTH